MNVLHGIGDGVCQWACEEVHTEIQNSVFPLFGEITVVVVFIDG